MFVSTFQRCQWDDVPGHWASCRKEGRCWVAGRWLRSAFLAAPTWARYQQIPRFKWVTNGNYICFRKHLETSIFLKRNCPTMFGQLRMQMKAVNGSGFSRQKCREWNGYTLQNCWFPLLSPPKNANFGMSSGYICSITILFSIILGYDTWSLQACCAQHTGQGTKTSTKPTTLEISWMNNCYFCYLIRMNTTLLTFIN